MNVCSPPLGRRRTDTTSSSGARAVRFTPRRNSSSGSAASPADAFELDLGALCEERRQRVSCRRGGTEVAADRPAVPDLRRADRSGRLGEGGQQRSERRAHRLRVREGRAEPELVSFVRPAAELGELCEVDERLRPRVAEVQLDHDVRAALDPARLGQLRLQAERLLERARREDVHGGRQPQAPAGCPRPT